MEVLTIAILKAVATSCVKYYLTALIASSPIAYNKSDLGYNVPKWYMNPGIARSTFYAYGTSIKGDEFESISDAKEQAIKQMVEFIRLSNQKMIGDQIKYDESSIKQKRLLELFVRGDDLDGFIRVNMKVGKQDLVKVTNPETDMRAFVRVDVDSDIYNEFQTKTLHELKTRLTRQKTEDIMSEMEEELKVGKQDSPEYGTAAEAGAEKVMSVDDGPKTDNTKTDNTKADDRKTAGGKAGVDSAFDELDSEVNK